MRDLIRLLEGMAVAPISETIVRLGERYVEQGLSASLYDINNGNCEMFAQDVCDALGGENSLLSVEWADSYSVDGDGDEWDVALIQKTWPKCQPTHGLTWNDVRLSVPSHAWIVFQNRHYDAECPEGVDNFFELPLFRRIMERNAHLLRKRKPVTEQALDEANRWGNLYWFWFNPVENRLVTVEGTHASAAVEMGYTPDVPDANLPLGLEDAEVIGKAIADHWVRGRYGARGAAYYQDGQAVGTSWDASYELDLKGQAYELSLQGQPQDVLATARQICKRRRVADLFLDFGTEGEMESIHLTGAEKEAYLETGQLQEALTEMATRPDESMHAQTFYHGTSSTKLAKSILKNGLQPPELAGRKSFLTPVQGMVYLTPDISYALIYAAGGNYIGSKSFQMPYRGENKKEFERVLKNRAGEIDRYGYIFAVEGSALEAVQPDEDAVGELFHYILDGRDPNPAYTEPEFMRAWNALKTDATWFNRFKSHMSWNTTDRQQDQIKDGMMAYYAAGGKRAIKTMSDDMKAYLCSIGLHVAHQGALTPTACWQFDKTKIGYMAKDGSNFFEFAKRIR
jgi:hypothetical protein